MKSITVFRRIIISSQVLSPFMGSTAFVLGMRHHHRREIVSISTAVHASSMPSPRITKDDYELDFIAAATHAAVEREALGASGVLTKTTTARTFTTQPTRSPVAAVPVTNEQDYEFDFIAAATQAAIERETREAQEKARTEEPASFKILPAFVPPPAGTAKRCSEASSSVP